MKIYSAPLQGFTEAVWRNIHCAVFGGVDGYYTPFLRYEHGEIRNKDVRDVERKNNSAGYCPENCVWASKKDQANNRRGNILIELNGVRYTVAQFAERFHLNAQQLYAKLNQPRSKNNPNQMNLF